MQDSSTRLIVKTHAFGDALLATPAVAQLLRSPGNLRVLTGPSAAEVWLRMPGVSRITVAPFPASGMPGSLKLLLWTLGGLSRFRDIDECVVFHPSPAVRRWVRLLTSAPSRSGGYTPLGRWESAAGFDPRNLASCSYAKIAGVEVHDYRPVFTVKAHERAWAEAALGPGEWLAIAPGGARNPRDTVPQKLWPASRFGEIASRAVARGLNCVLLGDGHDRAAASAVADAAGRGVQSLCGRTSWGQTAAILERCRAFLGADSGAAHLATAVSTPSVVLFGPTSPEALYAPGLVEAVRASTACSPCYSNEVFRGCAGGASPCMFEIDVDAVWASLESLLNAHSSA
jgi:ADP-heptose:LPS heptosyltransferase